MAFLGFTTDVADAARRRPYRQSKVRVVRHRGRAFRSAPLSAHVAYLERDGVTCGGEKAHVFSATEDRADAMAFAGRGLNDRHHFRFAGVAKDSGGIEWSFGRKRGLVI